MPFLTGSHMAVVRYTGESLAPMGGLLWLLLAATVETGASRLQNGTGRASRLQNGTGKK
jgi:hypothetical protein